MSFRVVVVVVVVVGVGVGECRGMDGEFYEWADLINMPLGGQGSQGTLRTIFWINLLVIGIRRWRDRICVRPLPLPPPPTLFFLFWSSVFFRSFFCQLFDRNRVTKIGFC